MSHYDCKKCGAAYWQECTCSEGEPMTADEALTKAEFLKEHPPAIYPPQIGVLDIIEALAAEVRRLQKEDHVWDKHGLCEIVERAEKAEAEARRLREELSGAESAVADLMDATDRYDREILRLQELCKELVGPDMQRDVEAPHG